MIDYKRKQGTRSDREMKEQDNLLRQAEEQYLQNLQHRLLNGEESNGEANGLASNEYMLSVPPRSSRATKEKDQGETDLELLRTIRGLERMQVEKDEIYLNGENERPVAQRNGSPVRAAGPRDAAVGETIEELPAPPSQPVVSTYEPGTILKLQNGSVGVFKESLADKDYDIVYYLLPSGKMEPQGISFFSYPSERIGKLPAQYLSRMEDRMRWDRDLIVYHLDSFELSDLIPQIQSVAEETPSGQANADNGRSAVMSVSRPAPARKRVALERGRKFKIRMGNREWEAVYWGSDDNGAIVAYNSNQRWELTRLDLKRYEKTLEAGDYLSSRETKEIEDSLLQNNG